jgi:hypothetical protein
MASVVERGRDLRLELRGLVCPGEAGVDKVTRVVRRFLCRLLLLGFLFLLARCQVSIAFLFYMIFHLMKKKRRRRRTKVARVLRM